MEFDHRVLLEADRAFLSITTMFVDGEYLVTVTSTIPEVKPYKTKMPCTDPRIVKLSLNNLCLKLVNRAYRGDSQSLITPKPAHAVKSRPDPIHDTPISPALRVTTDIKGQRYKTTVKSNIPGIYAKPVYTDNLTDACATHDDISTEMFTRYTDGFGTGDHWDKLPKEAVPLFLDGYGGE